MQRGFLAVSLSAGIAVAGAAFPGPVDVVDLRSVQRGGPAATPLHAVPGLLEMPASANDVPPMVFTVVTTRTDEHGTRRVSKQTVTRTIDRIRLVPDGSQREWLFERNPVDPRRISGYLIDHRARQILVHQESDLRNREQLRGWADAWFMRFEPRQLSGMRRTKETVAIGGATFARYIGGGASGEAEEVLWSDRYLLPGQLTFREAAVVTISRIENLKFPSRTPDLGDPRALYPQYQVLDLADVGDDRH